VIFSLFKGESESGKVIFSLFKSESESGKVIFSLFISESESEKSEKITFPEKGFKVKKVKSNSEKRK